MTNFTELPSVPSDRLVPFTDQLRLAVAAYLARFKGSVVAQHRRIAERLDGEVEAVRLVCAPLRGALLHGGLRWRATQFGSVAMRPGSISHFGGGQVVVTYAAPAETAVVAPLGRT